MLSKIDLENLIAVKKREIQREKTLLGLSSVPVVHTNEAAASQPCVNNKQVHFTKDNSTCDTNEENTNGTTEEKEIFDIEESIPADLERYIRRYLGLPVMLKAGEYSPNNPLIRGERTTGDVLVGLGEYERRRNTLRKIRQQQYREYLDQQAKKKQEAKEDAERERREREEREREREERERRRLEEELERSPERRRAASLSFVPSSASAKKDTGVQVDGITRPLSVAVQTDDAELFQLSSSSKCELTEAERELSPRTVVECSKDTQLALKHTEQWKENQCARRRSYGDFDERTCSIVNKTNRDKLVSDLRHTYMPSIFDADAIELRNMQAEKEAAERRQFYQQELRNQIMEQQRIKEERKTREKMLEQAEMRRLEEQLRMLKTAQEREVIRQSDITSAIKDHAEQYDTKRTQLQKEIDDENQKLKSKSQYTRTTTSKSDTTTNKLPFYYSKNYNKTPYTINIPESSIFSSNYDVDSYLRRNLNFKGQIGKSTSVDDFRIANDSVDIEKPLARPNFLKKYSSKSIYSNKLESAVQKESPKNVSPQSRNNNFEFINKDKENNEKNIGDKDKSPFGKDNMGQYDNKIDDYDIDDIITRNNKYTRSKDIKVIQDKDSDVVVKKRNTNFQIVEGNMENNDSLDVQVRERTDKYTISRDKNDKYPITGDKNQKYRDKSDEYTLTSGKSDKYTTSRYKNDKYPISGDKKPKYSSRNNNDEYTLSNGKSDKYTISQDKNDKYIEYNGKTDKNTTNMLASPVSKDKTDKNMTDMLPIPILRHSPKIQSMDDNNTNMSDAMKLVDDKWKVPAVQKNILKNVKDDGKNVSILTQLGSIRRQLQLEQLKLDKMLTKDDV
ncbi:hypothetical protein K1T71_012682 [Dendrolimus kikuchii]|uniref:Uncharacterized protein n=1 Tax=Dendrolimus kikuchii TaxID=765133 RepID=A0ACC1CK10_9NEOP|nr:hypothetical protein K1T71_012682 [Dendrolimus kikuchii]